MCAKYVRMLGVSVVWFALVHPSAQADPFAISDARINAKNVLAQRAFGFELGDEIYALPKDLVKGKGKVTLRFQAHAGCWAGGVFGMRVVREADR